MKINSVPVKSALMVGSSLFFAFVAAHYLGSVVLFSDAGEGVYSAVRQTESFLLFFFPNSLFFVLGPAIGSDVVAILAVGCFSAASFFWMGRLIARGFGLLRLVVLYHVVSALAFLASEYVFFKYFFMRPSPFSLF